MKRDDGYIGVVKEIRLQGLQICVPGVTNYKAIKLHPASSNKGQEREPGQLLDREGITRLKTD